MVTLQPHNDRVAAVYCPASPNLPPVGLAYLKGAVKNRPVRCFDFNLQFFQELLPDYGQVFDPRIPGVDFFAGKNVDFAALEGACERSAQTYRAAFSRWREQLAGYGVVGFSVNMNNLLASVVLARMLKAGAPAGGSGTVTLAGGPSMNLHQRDCPVLAGRRHLRLRRAGDRRRRDRAAAGPDRGRRRLPQHSRDRLPRRRPSGLYGARAARWTRSARRPITTISPSTPISSRRNWISLYAVIGCMGRCEFCNIHEFYEKYSVKSVETLKQEMLAVRQRYGRNHIFFSDGMFLGKRAAAMELFDFAIANDFRLGLQIRLMPYWNDEALVAKGWQCVFYLQSGFESASPAVRRAMGKMVNQAATESIFRLFHDYGLPLYTNIIIGYPNETDEEFDHTYRFLDDYLRRSKMSAIGTNPFFIPELSRGEIWPADRRVGLLAVRPGDHSRSGQAGVGPVRTRPAARPAAGGALFL